MKNPDANSKRTARKKVRGIQTSSPNLNKRCHKRAARRQYLVTDNKGTTIANTTAQRYW